MLPYLYVILGLAFVALLLLGPRSLALSPLTMYLVGILIFIAPGALLQESPLWPIHDETALWAFWVLAISVVFFAFGYVAVATRAPNVNRGETDAVYSIHPVTVVCFLVIAVAIKLFLDPDTIIGRVFTNVERTDDLLQKYLQELSSLPVGLACLAPWLWTRLRRGAWTFVGRVAIVGLALVGSFSLSRTPIFYVLGTYCLYVLWNVRTFWVSAGFRLFVLISVIATIPAAIFAAAFIKSSNLAVGWLNDGTEFSADELYISTLKTQYRLAISDCYGNLLYVLDTYPEVRDFMPGVSLAVIAMTPLPRSEVPWKPQSASYYVTNGLLGAEFYELTGTSLAEPFAGEMWMNGGWFAVGLGALLFGALGGLLQKKIGDKNAPQEKQLIYMMVLVCFLLIARGDLLSTFVRGFIYIGFAFVSTKLLTLVSRKQMPPAPAEAYRRLRARTVTKA